MDPPSGIFGIRGMSEGARQFPSKIFLIQKFQSTQLLENASYKYLYKLSCEEMLYLPEY